MSPKTNKKLLVLLTTDMANERAAYLVRERSQGTKKYRESQATLLDTVQAIGKTGDIGLILTAEKDILRNEMRFYGNSAGQRGSIKSALQELELAQKMLPLVHDGDLYLAVDASHGNPKSRVGGLPRDAARQFFASHNARLLNADKARLTDTEKKIVDARRHNVRVASLVYIGLQEKALGKDLRVSRGPSLSM